MLQPSTVFAGLVHAVTVAGPAEPALGQALKHHQGCGEGVVGALTLIQALHSSMMSLRTGAPGLSRVPPSRAPTLPKLTPCKAKLSASVQLHADTLGEQDLVVEQCRVCRLFVPCLQAGNPTAPAVTSPERQHPVLDLPESCSIHLEQKPLEAPQLSLLLRLEVVQVGGVDQVQPQPHVPGIGEVTLALQACKRQGLSSCYETGRQSISGSATRQTKGTS